MVLRYCTLSLFIAKKLAAAQYKLLGDGSYFGAILGLSGVWANVRTLERCRVELCEVLTDWCKLDNTLTLQPSIVIKVK